MRVETHAMPGQLPMTERLSRWIWIKLFHIARIPDAEEQLDYPRKLEDWFEQRRLFLERETNERK